jgi:hypothetical protein
MEPSKFEYFMERTEQDLAHIRQRVDTLWDYRLIQLGGALVVSLICSGIVTVLALYFDAKK